MLYAIKNHPLVMAAQASEKAAVQSVKEEKSRYYPTASVGLGFGRVFADNTTTRGLSVTRGTGYSWYGDGTASINQTVYDWSATDNSVSAAKFRRNSADASLDNQQSSIAFQAAQAYIQVLRSQILMQQAQAHLTAMKSFRDRIQTLVSDGGGDRSELTRADDIVLLADNALNQYTTDHTVALANYIEIIGREPDGDLSNPDINLQRLPNAIDEAISLAIKMHPQMKMAQSEANAAYYEKEKEEANLLPNLNAELSYTKRDQRDLIGGESEDRRALLRMNWDISFGGAELASQRRAEQLEKEAAQNYEAQKRTIARDIRVAWASHNLAQKQHTNEQDRYKTVQNTYGTFKEQYEGGQKSILELMIAEDQSFAVQQNLINARYREMESAYALMSVIGLPITTHNDGAS